MFPVFVMSLFTASWSDHVRPRLKNGKHWNHSSESDDLDVVVGDVGPSIAVCMTGKFEYVTME